MQSKILLVAGLVLGLSALSARPAFANEWKMTLDSYDNGGGECFLQMFTYEDGVGKPMSTPWYQSIDTNGVNCILNTGQWFKYLDTDFIAFSNSDNSLVWGWDVGYLTNGEVWDDFNFSCTSDRHCEISNIIAPTPTITGSPPPPSPTGLPPVSDNLVFSPKKTVTQLGIYGWYALIMSLGFYLIVSSLHYGKRA